MLKAQNFDQRSEANAFRQFKLRETGEARDWQKLKTDCCYINQHLLAPDVMCLRILFKITEKQKKFNAEFLRLAKKALFGRNEKQSRAMGKFPHF